MVPQFTSNAYTLEASRTGVPLLRTMFYEFPEDQRCWKLDDQYMFGDKYLVAPVLEADMMQRQVYLPVGTWRDIADGKEYAGGQALTCETPIERIPVFERSFGPCKGAWRGARNKMKRAQFPLDNICGL